MLKTSVIITTCNDAEFLPGALSSVVSQSVPPLEIIVVDDGSRNDRAQEICEAIETSIPVRFSKKPNGGPSSARNHGLGMARGEMIAFLDADDAWLPTNLEYKQNMCAPLPAEYFGVYGSFVHSDTGKSAPFMSHDGKLPPDGVGRPGCFPGGVHSYLFRQDALLAAHGFDESLYIFEDFDLILRMIHLGRLCRGNARAGFIRNMRKGSITRDTQVHKRSEASHCFLDKAERENLLSPAEIAIRRKDVSLRLAQDLLLISAAPRVEVKAALKTAFAYDKPRSLKEWLAYGFSFLP